MQISEANRKSENFAKTNKITNSEKKRLQSVKQKKEAFKNKERLIRDALNNLESKTKSNKIIFDEDFGENHVPEKPKKKHKKRGTQLFDDDNDECDSAEFQIDINKDKRIAKMPNALQYDPRFTLDDRFAEDGEEGESKDVEKNDESDLQNEKEWQLDILGSVLGAPVIPRDKHKQTSAKKGKMIRYDPSVTKHKEYEIAIGNLEPETKQTKKKKKSKVTEEVQEAAPVEVSKDIFYSVSNVLKSNLKQEEQFSLLKTYGRAESSTENTNNKAPEAESAKDKVFKFTSAPPNKIFKYDSSDDENANQQASTKNSNVDDIKNKNYISNIYAEKQLFFFESNDARFNDAVKFFNEESMPSVEFKNLRRELKQIVRKKIRNNVKKRQPWGKKRKVKK